MAQALAPSLYYEELQIFPLTIRIYVLPGIFFFFWWMSNYFGFYRGLLLCPTRNQEHPAGVERILAV